MPKRSTPFQAIVHMVREQMAEPGVTVTESKMLFDPHLEVEREVDVVVEGTFDGDPVVTSIEVIEHQRAAPVTWVEQQVQKHRYLATNRLILVSQAGFSRTALTAVASQGGWVEAVQPKLVEQDGKTVLEKVFPSIIRMTPTEMGVQVIHPNDGSALMVDACSNIGVFLEDGTEVGGADRFVLEALNVD